MVNKSNTDFNNFKQLSILISQDGFLFYLHHDKPEQSMSLEVQDITDVLNSKSLNLFQTRFDEITKSYEFKTLKLDFSNAFYALVPEDYYQDNAKADYLKYNVKLFEEDQIVADHIPSINAYQVYIPLMNYHNAVLDQVEEFEYEHFTNALIKQSYLKSFDSAQQLKVYVQKSHINVIAQEGQKFKLCNTFNYETDLDLVYYVLFCVEELKFNQREMQLELYHDSKDTTWLEIIKRYILNVKCKQKNLVAFIV
ncbi:DUF3822 family protein [Flavobacterium sp. CS20]|uniref:DUF3822 family protein n=1 Tax=Flavobacterium sp. CS20 TaxID=2775246 RepID=UPI001B3A5492|nr:DUF3822 family protein [Flavobacterium sp. CS20]QTY27370.1 DUF3822 family protein [Flavobacterium sp. CS20]